MSAANQSSASRIIVSTETDYTTRKMAGLIQIKVMGNSAGILTARSVGDKR
jgi:hypothetical protein